MAEKTGTGASDLRSDDEKEKSHLRTAMMSVFKSWIPEHPEASAERDQAYGLLCRAMQARPRMTMVSALSTGVDDIVVHEYLDGSLSLQEVLVQREGTEAFLDPRNALRVVRRKYGMMTLITRMTGTLEHRNIVALSLTQAIERNEFNDFTRLISQRIVDSSAEEEQVLRKAILKAGFKHIEVLFHSDVVGRRLPLPWEVKHLYALVGRATRLHGADPLTSARRAVQGAIGRLRPKAIRQLCLYARELDSELDIPGVATSGECIAAANDVMMLNATRSIFDEYQELRRSSIHERALGLNAPAPSAPDAKQLIEQAGDFLADADASRGSAAEEDLARHARALDRIRAVRGREFFSRISMVSGDLDFEGAARAGSGQEQADRPLAAMDPLESLRAARKVVEPFYRARALTAAALSLVALGRDEEARNAATESLDAARACQTSDAGQAFGVALECLLAVRSGDLSATCTREAIDYAHSVKDLDERVAALMRVASTLMEAGALPQSVRSGLSRTVLGRDVHFWGKLQVTPALVEAIVSLLPGVDEDSLIFLNKVISHPTVEVRCSVIRTLPFGGNPELRAMLVAHLKDKDATVRTEVIERIGWSGERSLLVYLVNHARHGLDEDTSHEEKRALALNLARLDGERQLAMFNAMLGPLGTEDAALVGKVKPFKNDEMLQMAALEVLFHLHSRGARRLAFNAFEKAKKRHSPLAHVTEKMWSYLKHRPYAEPELPRSPHDPAFGDDDRQDFADFVEQLMVQGAQSTAPAPMGHELDGPPPAATTADPLASAATPEAPATSTRPSAAGLRREPRTTPPVAEPEGLFNRLKAKLFSRPPYPASSTELSPDATPAAQRAPSEHSRPAHPAGELDAAAADRSTANFSTPGTRDSNAPGTVAAPLVVREPHAVLRFQGTLQAGDHPLNSSLSLGFTLYAESDGPTELWSEVQSTVSIVDGAFDVTVGVDKRLPAPLPSVVWLKVTVDAGGRNLELRPFARISRARSVVQG